jgi:hypothetical protein
MRRVSQLFVVCMHTGNQQSPVSLCRGRPIEVGRVRQTGQPRPQLVLLIFGKSVKVIKH